MITVKNINGKPETIPSVLIFGTHSDAKNFYFFETQEELDDHNANVEASAVTEPEKQVGIALEAFSKATEEEKILIAQELKKYL